MLPNPDEKLDPRVIRTRGLILHAFWDLIAEKNFESISVQDVTDKAQVNRATFYAHFQDKYALLDYSIGQMFKQEIEKRTLSACHYSHDNLRSLILAVCEFHSRLHGECAQPHEQFESLVEGQIKKHIFGLLSHWLSQPTVKVSTEIPATVATWAIYGLASYYGHNKKRPALEKFVDEALPLVAINLEQFA
jgi:AcrR family transcriptional regulator